AARCLYSFKLAAGTRTLRAVCPCRWTTLFRSGSRGYVETLVGGQQATGNDFGNFQQATKSGRKFNDLNGDGVEQATEPGLSGWTIRLERTAAPVTPQHRSTTTDPNRAYSFKDD